MRSPISTVSGIYGLLERIVPARTPNDFATLATTAPDSAATCRSVLLRGFDPDLHQVWVNTNLHTAKVTHLRRHPNGELSLWLPRKKIQLRLMCAWRVIDGAIAARTPAWSLFRDNAWLTQPPYARKLYDTGSNADAPPHDFAVLVGTLHRIDALRLTRSTYEQYLHERPRNAWQSCRLVP